MLATLVINSYWNMGMSGVFFNRGCFQFLNDLREL